ncbi:MAG: hypothetical protein KDC66_00630 [Phaeodactylibacter sp.]|nr:hypothetical protein [Phaeodactylibacter sp.]MCB9273270.1 hypothetical protein [Lewinellaceae bacterium]
MRSQALVIIAFLISAVAYAQDCSIFYPFKEGVSMEYTNYNKKGKVESSTANTITVVETSANGAVATITSIIRDDKGKEQFTGDYTVRCEDGVIIMDASNMISPAMQQSISGMEVSMEGKGLTLPNKLQAGQELPDASTTIKAGSNGITIINMTVNVTNRKVLGREEVTTPAGTFNCYKITQDTDVKLMVAKTITSVDYYAEGVGVVRSETYDKKGNLEGYMELTKFEK